MAGALIILALLVFVAITDENENDWMSSGRIIRIINMLIFGGTNILMATALYISYTPVGRA